MHRKARMNTANVSNVVVVGSGFGGLEAAFYLRKRLGRHVKLTMVSEHDTFLFKPNTIYIPFGKPPEAFVFPLRSPGALTICRRDLDSIVRSLSASLFR